MNEDKYKREHSKHLAMLLGSLIPIAVVMGFRFLNIETETNGLSAYAMFLFLLCPLMHILMMFNVIERGGRDYHDENVDDYNNNNKIEN